jgi:serine/threonine protein kinase
VKLIDFDVSKMLDENADHTLKRGTNRWMAPEVWGLGAYKRGGTRQTAPYGTSIDVYSFGMTCYEVITGLRPFHEYFRNDELRWALENEKRPILPPGMSYLEALKELISRCWAQKPTDRPNFKEVEKALWAIKYQLEL